MVMRLLIILVLSVALVAVCAAGVRDLAHWMFGPVPIKAKLIRV